MTAKTVTTWTCDLCGGVDVQPGTDKPLGWRNMKIDGWPNQNYVEHLVVCSACMSPVGIKERLVKWWRKDRESWR